MKKSIVIQIPEPCHEDWAQMSATEKGKFCDVCTKEVIDFTSKSDEELVKILSKNKNACGRLKSSQLNREVKMERKSGFNYGALAASVLLPMTVFSNNPKSENLSSIEKNSISLGIGRFSNQSLERIRIETVGVITSENGEPIRNAKITVLETGKSVFSDKNGYYSIMSLNAQTLIISAVNFDSQEIILGNSSKTINANLQNLRLIDSSIIGKIALPEIDIIEKDSAFVTISGVITDDTGLPLPGANIIIEGTSNGTQSDFDGIYSLETKPGDVLVFSYVGFENTSITVSNISNAIDVEMQMGDYLLGEVITVGGYYVTETATTPKNAEWKANRKQAYSNTKKFNKILKERKKEERRKKRNQE